MFKGIMQQDLYLLGMDDGYADNQPKYWTDKEYRDGYLSASHERYCHSGEKSSWVITEKYQKFPYDPPRPYWATPWKYKIF